MEQSLADRWTILLNKKTNYYNNFVAFFVVINNFLVVCDIKSFKMESIETV